MSEQVMLGAGLAGLAGRRNAALQLRWSYYGGKQPRIWVTDKFATRFRDLADSMSDNYCSLAVNARVSRLEVTGWDGTDAEPVEALWEENRWPQRQTDFYRWALAYGQAYLIVGEDDDGVAIAPNRPTMVWHESADDDPTLVSWAVKVWQSQGAWRATLYTEDEIARFVSTETDPRRMPALQTFKEDPDDPGGSHGFDQCPVVVTYPYGFDAPVLMDTIRGTQDRINKISANKFVAAEFSVYAQRVFFTRQDVQQKDVVNAPDHAIILDPGDAEAKASVTELAGGDLSKFDEAKQAEVDTLFTLATLPRHLMVNPGVAPSGEAIKADEGPFTESVVNSQAEFSAAYERALEIAGYDAEPVWRNPEVSNDMADAQTVRAFVDSGVPWQEAARRYAGWSQEDIDGVVTVTPATGLTTQPPDAAGAALLAGL